MAIEEINLNSAVTINSAILYAKYTLPFQQREIAYFSVYYLPASTLLLLGASEIAQWNSSFSFSSTRTAVTTQCFTYAVSATKTRGVIDLKMDVH